MMHKFCVACPALLMHPCRNQLSHWVSGTRHWWGQFRTDLFLWGTIATTHRATNHCPSNTLHTARVTHDLEGGGTAACQRHNMEYMTTMMLDDGWWLWSDAWWMMNGEWWMVNGDWVNKWTKQRTTERVIECLMNDDWCPWMVNEITGGQENGLISNPVSAWINGPTNLMMTYEWRCVMKDEGWTLVNALWIVKDERGIVFDNEGCMVRVDE